MNTMEQNMKVNKETITNANFMPRYSNRHFNNNATLKPLSNASYATMLVALNETGIVFLRHMLLWVRLSEFRSFVLHKQR